MRINSSNDRLTFSVQNPNQRQMSMAIERLRYRFWSCRISCNSSNDSRFVIPHREGHRRVSAQKSTSSLDFHWHRQPTATSPRIPTHRIASRVFVVAPLHPQHLPSGLPLITREDPICPHRRKGTYRPSHPPSRDTWPPVIPT